MDPNLHPLAGQPAPAAALVDLDALLGAYHALHPDPAEPGQRIAFGTSGHRGSSLQRSFNEHHVLAITQALCEYRAQAGIAGPLFLGIDSHALSGPAFETALQVLAANGVDTRIASGTPYTPTPAVSHAILVHNRAHGGTRGQADGIVLTPSHNPPDGGGYKYNPPHGGAADGSVTGWIQERANALLAAGLAGVRRLPLAQALQAATTRPHDFRAAYVADLGQVIDFDVIRGAGLRLAVDPLGGAGVDYWAHIAEHWRIDLDLLSQAVDPRFAFMTLDWDGQIRMDPSSRHAMQPLLARHDRYDVAWACDTDHDRHGIVARSAGLLPSNHYLATMIDYLGRHRPGWRADAAIGKTCVSSAMIDRVVARLGRPLLEVPVGFKWYAEGLQDGSLAFAGEESAGAAFARRDGSAWTSDKDGLVPGLLAAEMSACSGRDPGELYRGLCADLGETHATRVDAAATPAQKRVLARLAPAQVASGRLAGDAVLRVLDRAPGNGAALGGIKVETAGGWFAARPSGTEDIYKIYAESYRDPAHLQQLVVEAQALVDAALAAA